MKKTLLWIGSLVVGAIFGVLGLEWLNTTADFVAAVYTRLFQLLAVPTIVLAVITTFATFGSKGSGRIFGRTLIYTLLTTFTAAAVGALLYVVIAPGNLPAEAISSTTQPSDISPQTSLYDHILNVIPNNIVKPFLEGNVLSLLLLAFAVGIGLSKLPLRPTLGPGFCRCRGRLHRKICPGGAGRQCHSVLHRPAAVPPGSRFESYSYFGKDDARRLDGPLYQE